MAKISVIGTGFIAKGFIRLLINHPKHQLGKILTRSDLSKRDDLNEFSKYLTTNLDEVIESSDLVVESSGDAIYACDTIDAIVKAGLPVVTMNSEFHVTVGSYFVNKGLVTEAEGDQPGVLAMLHEEAISMGFKPLAYANIKGFLNHTPTLEDMTYWGNRSGISLDMVTSFTDGTKIQIEQTLIANGLKASIAQEGLIGLPYDDMTLGGNILASKAKNIGSPISDYLLSTKLPAGVFLVAEHHPSQKGALNYLKLGDGPYYILDRTFHLCHLEIIKTIKRVLAGGGVLLDNSASPRVSVASIAKRDLKAGTKIKKGIGSFDVRGIAVNIKENKNHVPIGLLEDITLSRDVKAGERITFDDIEMPNNRAVEIWKEIIKTI